MKITESVCHIAEEFRRRKDISMYQLLKDSKYIEMPDTVSEESIENYLKKHPALVDSWLQESEDQRTSPAWYFIEHNGLFKKKWIVGYHPDGEKYKFKDKIEACAFYVFKTIQCISKIK